MKTSTVTGSISRRWIRRALAGAAFFVAVGSFSIASAAGLLKPAQGGGSGISIKSHDVKVVINNGFSRTEVDQVFMNEADRDMEAIYTLPLPKQASLSELSLWIDGKESIGEVVEKERAKTIYEKQKSEGKDTAIAEKDDFKTINIGVGVVRANSEARVRFVYYQPVEIDLNVGRYVYPLAEGGVDEERIQFWSVDSAVREKFTFNLELKSAFPVKDLRMPEHQNKAQIEKVPVAEQSDGEIYRVRLDKTEGADLSRDIVFYYRLDDSVPARVELVPYREGGAGTVMVVVTPAASLKRISEGVDWTFVLDTSGSMSGRKIETLVNGVSKAIGKMSPKDRFRIVTFNTRASDFSVGFVQATEENVRAMLQRLKEIQASGSTALYDGLNMAYQMLDGERTTGIILVTDGVANEGPTDHANFLKLVKKYDVRLFTIVIGNSANQPLMDRLAKDSGGFAMNISEGDDITGRLLQAKAKVLHECLHDVSLTFTGEKVYDVTPIRPVSLYMGQQLVMFGRYSGHGDVEVELKGKISGQEQSWKCRAELPLVDTDNPELERLWALSAIDDQMEMIRQEGESESRIKKVVALGKEYSIVTDYTSMIVLREEEMEGQQIERRNAARSDRERQAQQIRDTTGPKSYRVDQSAGSGGAFGGASAPRIGSSPVGPLFVGLAWWLSRRKKDQ